MKNIIIWGPVRSYKTYTANKLAQKFSMEVIEVDDIRQIFEQNNPNYEWEQMSSFDVGTIMNGFFAEFLIKKTKELNERGRFVVFEGSTINLNRLSETVNLNSFEIICLSYPRILETEKFSQIRFFEKEEDWTRQFDDSSLHLICKKNIIMSRFVRDLAKRKGYVYYDVSYCKREEIVKIIIEHIEKTI